MITSANAAWMFSSLLVAVLLAIAAPLLERVVSMGRGTPVRWIWFAALIAAVFVSAVRLRQTAPSQSLTAVASSVVGRMASAGIRTPFAAGTGSANGVAALRWLQPPSFPRLPRLSPSIERGLRRVWLLGTIVLLGVLGWSASRVNRERRQWKPVAIQGEDVLLSDGFGPAIVGFAVSHIVVPPWFLALAPASQRAILVHEDEHRRAKDPLLLLGAMMLVVLMPWNIGLWLLWRGLHRAIELDCDERVLQRGISSGEYANVLLGAWAQAHGRQRWLPSPAFAERASGLGKRVEHLMRQEPRGRVVKTIIGSVVSGIVMLGAVLIPMPQYAQSAAVARAVVPLGLPPLVVIDGVKRKDMNTVEALKQIAARREAEAITITQLVDSTNAVRLYGADGSHGAMVMWSKSYIAKGGAMLPRGVTNGEMSPRADPTTSTAEMTGRIYDHLLRGIVLDDARATQARAIISFDQGEQAFLNGPFLYVWPRRMALLDTRDAKLRALLASNEDRARFDANAERPSTKPITAGDVAVTEVTNYYRDLGASADETARATASVEHSLLDELRMYDNPPVDNAARTVLLAKRVSDIRNILDTDAKRTAFDARAKIVENIRSKAESTRRTSP
jgi:beta-lactamase regulating signal transducer with metallopeptidase domain